MLGVSSARNRHSKHVGRHQTRYAFLRFLGISKATQALLSPPPRTREQHLCGERALWCTAACPALTFPPTRSNPLSAPHLLREQRRLRLFIRRTDPVVQQIRYARYEELQAIATREEKEKPARFQRLGLAVVLEKLVDVLRVDLH